MLLNFNRVTRYEIKVNFDFIVTMNVRFVLNSAREREVAKAVSMQTPICGHLRPATKSVGGSQTGFLA
jgi:hypothetical protein